MPPNPSEILSSKKMKEFIACVREYYDYKIIPHSEPTISINRFVTE